MLCGYCSARTQEGEPHTDECWAFRNSAKEYWDSLEVRAKQRKEVEAAIERWQSLSHQEVDESMQLHFLRELLIQEPSNFLEYTEFYEVSRANANDTEWWDLPSKTGCLQIFNEYRAMVKIDDDTGREALTTAALMLSLCPLHFIDYAICFDDADEECEVIRKVHPSHDS